MGKIINKKFILSLLITVIGFFALISGTSYAILKGTAESTNEQIIRAGSVELVLTENFEGINQGISAMKDPDGLLQETVYEFNIRNTGSVTATYDLKLEDSGTNAISDSFIKVGLEVNGKEIGPMKLSSVSNVIDSNVINKNEVIRYKMRLWIDHLETNSFTGDSTANLKLKVDAKQSEYKETVVYKFGSEYSLKGSPIKADTYTGYCAVGSFAGSGTQNSCTNYATGFKTQESCQKAIEEWGGSAAGYSCVAGNFTINETATTDYTTLNKNYFLEYVLQSDVVTEIHACYKLNNQLYCLKGGGTYNTSTNSWSSNDVKTNKEILLESFGTSKCNEANNTYTCTSGNLVVGIDNTGYISISETDAEYACRIYQNNVSSCGFATGNGN